MLHVYNAWGEILQTTGTLATTLGQTNPIRYKGYYYDTETGFYYLNSRYYDPILCRFVNADSLTAGLGDNFLGNNLYAYCFNNPVNMSDESGNWPTWEEIGKQIKKAATLTYRIMTAPLKAIETEVGVGIGIGAEATVDMQYFSIAASAKNAVTNSVIFEDGKFDVRNTTSISKSFSLWNINFGSTSGKQHSFFDDDCTCDFFNDPIAKGTQCPANKSYSNKDLKIGVSASIYALIGAEASYNINITKLANEILDIYAEIKDIR